MGSRYPSLKIGDAIQCKTYREAFALGVDLTNEGFSYQIRGNNKLFVTERDYFDNEKEFKRDRKGNKRKQTHA